MGRNSALITQKVEVAEQDPNARIIAALHEAAHTLQHHTEEERNIWKIREVTPRRIDKASFSTWRD